MQVLNSKTHGIVDYLVVIFLVVSPAFFNLYGTARIFTYALAAVHFLLTVITIYEHGIFRLIPLKVHGWIELVVSITLVGVAFYFGTAGDSLAKIFYLCFAAAVFLTWLLTDYHYPGGRKLNRR